jgi:hypothetical protein
MAASQIKIEAGPRTFPIPVRNLVERFHWRVDLAVADAADWQRARAQRLAMAVVHARIKCGARSIVVCPSIPT